MNEDVVLPMDRIPDFAHYLEQLNVITTAEAYLYALQELARKPGYPINDEAYTTEYSFASRIAGSLEEELDPDLSDTAVVERAVSWLSSQKERFPRLEHAIDKILSYFEASRIIVASHMHAGDGEIGGDAHASDGDERIAQHGLHLFEEETTSCSNLLLTGLI